MPPPLPILMVLGATGTGKSQLAIQLAKRFGGEVVNSDAMQVYRGLEVVTNKVSEGEMEGVRHHLIGEVGFDDEGGWGVGRFRRRVGEVVCGIRGRGMVPVVVGGTGYYLQSLLGGGEVDEMEGEGKDVNDYEDVLGEGVRTEELLRRLWEVDPVMAARWHPNDRRKIRRSLEIWVRSGRRASEVYEEQRVGRGVRMGSDIDGVVEGEMEGDVDVDDNDDDDGGIGEPLLFWIHAEDKTLKERLNKRVDKMIDSGLLSEVQEMGAFLKKQEAAGKIVDRTQGIWVSIGFKEFEAYLDATRRKEMGEDVVEGEVERLYTEAVELTKGATRRYAKRQVRWIRLKLIPALQEQQRLQRLYLLDGTDLSKWEEHVIEPAVAITKAFLEGKEMPAPGDVNEVSKEFLGEGRVGMGKPDVWFREECEGCGVVCVTNLQWGIHLKSRRHRGMLRRAGKQKQNYNSGSVNGKEVMEIEEVGERGDENETT